MPRQKPSLSTYCRCGQQWHGRYAVDNRSIREHEARCGPPVTKQTFEGLGYRDKAPRPDPPSKTNLSRWRKKHDGRGRSGHGA